MLTPEIGVFLQVTSDGVPVLWHDDELLTIGSNNEVTPHSICDLTLDNFRRLASGRTAEYQGMSCQLARKFAGQGPSLWPHNNGGEPCTLQEALEVRHLATCTSHCFSAALWLVSLTHFILLSPV